MTALWTNTDICSATGGRTSGEWDADGISIDSRTVAAGDLFVALSGPRFDGHDFVAEALDRGAAAAMVARDSVAGLKPVNEERLVIVDDTLDGLNALAAAARGRTGARIAAVTGSVGKTTTKEALALVLGRQGATHATTGNLNNHWGAPLSIARMPTESQFGVFELGMNHAGEIAPLSKLARPHVAIVTAVEAVHLEFFDSVDGIADAKAEIFQGLGPEGIAVLPADNPYHDRLAQAARASGVTSLTSFGTEKSAAYRLIAWSLTETGTRVAADIDGRRIVFEIGLRGKHMALNCLAALAAVAALGGDTERAAGDLYDMKPPKGRGARHTIQLDGGSFVLIDESYNASPASVLALINTVAATQRSGRLVLALGDMLELGPEARELHADLAVSIANAGVDSVFTAGPLMKSLHDSLPADMAGFHANDSDSLAVQVADVVRPGDVVAVKGSFGSRMSVVVDALAKMGANAPTNRTVVNGE